MQNSAITAIAIVRLIAIHFLLKQLVRLGHDDLDENEKPRHESGEFYVEGFSLLRK